MSWNKIDPSGVLRVSQDPPGGWTPLKAQPRPRESWLSFFTIADKGGVMEITTESIGRRIRFIRGQKVMLSGDLAALYGVTPKALIQAVKRNSDRFPDDFLIQLTLEESRISRSQIVTLKKGSGHNIKFASYAFTEQGVAMLSSVLRSKRAIQVNIAIMRAFIKIREALALHKDLARRLDDLESKVGGHDAAIRKVFEAIRQLTAQPETPRLKIGFKPEEPAPRSSS